MLTFFAIPHSNARSNASAQPKEAFPRVGKVARQRRMRAKQASVEHNATYLLLFASPVGGMRYTVRSSNGDPACWRPARGAGFDCAAMFGCRARPYTRCAASLRMTRRGAGARDGKQSAVSVSLTVLYFEPNKIRTTFHPTHRVILSEAAHRVCGRTQQPNNAAQSNPAPLAGRQQAGSPLFKRSV